VADPDLVDFAVDYARQKGATYAEARYEHQVNEQFILKNSVLDALYFGEDTGIGVRVLANGGLGFAATNSMAKADVKVIVEDAVRLAKAARRKDPIVFAPEEAVVTNWSIPQAKALSDVPVEDKIEEITHIDRELVDLKFKMPARYFQQGNKQIEKYFANSEGSRIKSFSPRVRLFYFLTMAHNGNVEQTSQNYGWSGGWEAIREVDMLRRTVEEAKSMQNSLSTGRSPRRERWTSSWAPRSPGSRRTSRAATPRRRTACSGGRRPRPGSPSSRPPQSASGSARPS